MTDKIMVLCFQCKMCGAKEYKKSSKSAGYNRVYYTDDLYLDANGKKKMAPTIHYCRNGSLGIFDLIGSYPKEIEEQ